MKLFKLQLKKGEPDLNSLHRQVFDPNYFWSLSLIIFATIAIAGSLLGVKLFRSVYAEDYRNEDEAMADTATNMNVDALERALGKRSTLFEKEIPISPDPSL